MKRGNLTTIFVLSLVFILSIQFISAPPTGSLTITSGITEGEFVNEGSLLTIVVEVLPPVGVAVEWGSLNITDEDGVETNLFNSSVLASYEFTYTFTTGNKDSYNVIAYAKFVGIDVAADSPMITIHKNNAPTASFSADKYLGLAPLTVQFTDASSDQDVGQSIASLAWDFGDASATAISALSNPTHTFATAGEYNVNLIATDSLGVASVAVTKKILVRTDCGTVAAGETCVPIPGDLECQGTLSAGLKCDDASAGLYCRTYQNGEYKVGSMTCDGNSAHALLNYGQPGSCGGSGQWIESLICIGEGAAQDCVDSDASYSDPTSIKGKVTIDNIEYNDTCASDGATLKEQSCSALGALEETEVTCVNGCDSGVCLSAGGANCAINGDLNLPQAPLKSRQKANDDVIYYCSLGGQWLSAKPTDTEGCLEDYECESNTCVDNMCISITAELQEQRSILQRIWCFLTNMGPFFATTTGGDYSTNNDRWDYCGCMYMDNGIVVGGAQEPWESCLDENLE